MNSSKKNQSLSILSLANDFFSKGNYQKALEAYFEVAKTPYLEEIAKFNIELIQKRIGPHVYVNSTDNCLNERPILEFAGNLTPLISIVIPAYNAKKYIEKTIRYIAEGAQSPIEIVVVDDGSNDGTMDILLRLKERYTNLTCLNQKNSGAGTARNKAIDFCKGVYTFFLDADDSIDINELCQAALDGQKRGSDLIFLPYKIWYEGINKQTAMFPSDMQLHRTHSSLKTLNSIKANALKLIGYPWNRLILTSSLKSHNIKFGTSSVHNDIRFHWHSVCASKSLSFWHKAVCTHNKFDSGTLSSDSGRRRFSAFSAIDETFETLKSDKFFIENQEIWIEVVQEMLTWNLKIINSDLKEEFNALAEKFKEEMKEKFLKIIYLGANSSANTTKENKKTVSIITITRNILGNEQEKKNNLKHFEDMIASVNKQTYGRAFIEHVVIDGNSNDGTKEILQELKNSKLIDVFVSEPDSGIYNAMNKGVSKSNGQLILFLNAHDKLSENALDSLVTALEKTEADYAFGDSLTIDEKDNPVGQHIGNINRIFFGMPYCHQSAIFKKYTFDKVAFPEDFKITTWKYALNLYTHGFRHVYIPGVIAYFRVGGVSTAETTRTKFWGELKTIKLEIAKNLLSIPYNIYEDVRTAALNNSLLTNEPLSKVKQIKESNGIEQERFCANLTHFMRK